MGYPDTRRVRVQAVTASCESGSGMVGAIIRVFPESRGPRSPPAGAVNRGDRGNGAGSCDRCGLQHGVHAADALYADSGALLLFAPTKTGPAS